MTPGPHAPCCAAPKGGGPDQDRSTSIPSHEEFRVHQNAQEKAHYRSGANA